VIEAATAADGSPIYWDHRPSMVTSFDDFERVATEYDIYGELLQSRAYDEDENARADAIQNERGVAVARANLERATLLNAAPAELAVLQEAILADEGLEAGDPWRQPTGAHDAYPVGAIVSHNGETWKSTTAANVWEPGVSGWAIEGDGIPPWIQPTGAHDAYPLGAIVTHNDLFWQSDVDANVWEPGVFGWTEIPEP